MAYDTLNLKKLAHKVQTVGSLMSVFTISFTIILLQCGIGTAFSRYIFSLPDIVETVLLIPMSAFSIYVAVRMGKRLHPVQTIP